MNLFGKYIDDNEKVLKSLTTIYGIGRPTAEELCMNFGIGLDKKVKELSKDTWSILIKAAELGPSKYKDLVKDLQESDYPPSGIKSSENLEMVRDKSSSQPISHSPKVVSFAKANSHSEEEGVQLKQAQIKRVSGDYQIQSNGKLRSQKVELRALTDLRERLDLEKKIKSYRGLRHLEGLPVRGQRTSTNALTARKRKK
jgi:ribosomal protein S13